MVGVEVVVALLPQELRTAARQPSASTERTRCHRTWPEPHRKFDSNTRSPPTHSTQIFVEEACQSSREAAGARIRDRRDFPARDTLAIGPLLPERHAPLIRLHPLKLKPAFAHLEASRAHVIRKPVRTHSPRGIDAVPHPGDACIEAECDNSPFTPHTVKRNPNLPGTAAPLPARRGLH